MPQFEKLRPSQGTPIRFENGQPVVADNPIIPFIRGDGTGVDIWPATQKVLDAAVAKAYGAVKASNGSRCMPAMRLRPLRHLVPTRRHPRGDPHLRRGDQGAAHHTG